MKTLLLFTALLWASAITKTFAADVTVSPVVMQSFNSSFRNATNVKWSVVDHLYRASFTVDDEQTIAFFTIEDGSLVASCHYLKISELPRGLQRSLKATAPVNSITEVFEVQNDDGTDYFATVQQGDKAVILKAAAAKWNVYKK